LETRVLQHGKRLGGAAALVMIVVVMMLMSEDVFRAQSSASGALSAV